MEHWVKYIAVARIHDNTVVATYFHDSQVKSQVNRIQAAIELKKILADLAFADSQQKFSSSYGIWYMITDEYQIAYLVLNKTDYPERHAWDLLKELKNIMCKQGADNIKSCQSDIYTRTLFSDLKTLSAKYDDLNNLDKLYNLNQNVIETHGIIQDCVHKTIRNIDNAGVNFIQKINDKAQEMEINAKGLSKEANKVKRFMCLKNAKMTILLVVVILVIVAIIVAVVASAANQTTDYT